MRVTVYNFLVIEFLCKNEILLCDAHTRLDMSRSGVQLLCVKVTPFRVIGRLADSSTLPLSA